MQSGYKKQLAKVMRRPAREQSDISKRPILNGRGNRKIKGEVTSIKVVRHVADGVKLQEDA